MIDEETQDTRGPANPSGKPTEVQGATVTTIAKREGGRAARDGSSAAGQDPGDGRLRKCISARCDG